MKKTIYIILLTLFQLKVTAQNAWIMPVPDIGAGNVRFVNTRNNTFSTSAATIGSYTSAVDRRGYVYIGGNNTVQVLSPSTYSVIASHNSNATVNLNLPVGMIVSDDNQYLYVTNFNNNSGTNSIAVFNISTPGTLVPVNNISLGVNGNPGWMDTDASGNLYIAIGSGWAKVVNPSASSPTITFVNTLPAAGYNGSTAFNVAPHSIAVDKTRDLVYVSAESGINTQVWSTTGVSQNLVYQTSGGNGHGISLSPDGNAIYVASSNSNNQRVYRFNRFSGTLPRTSGSSAISPDNTSAVLSASGTSGMRIVQFTPDAAKLYANGGNAIFELNPVSLATIATVGNSFSLIDPHGGGYIMNDFGDAPASYGTAAHSLSNNNFLNGLLKIGTKVDGDTTNNTSSTTAAFDDNSNPSAGLTDDEDAFSGALPDIKAATYSVTVPVTNNTGTNARMVVWVDFNKDGDFADAGETSVLLTVPSSASLQNIPVSFSGYTKGTASAAPTYMRIRLTTDALLSANAANARDAVFWDGEVEDFALNIAPVISGTVFNDANGTSDNTVNGTGIGSIGVQPLYVYLVNPSTGLIVDSAKVAANGTYSFDDGQPNTNYNIILSATQSAIGTANPPITLPVNWVNTAEHLGTGTGNDGNANSILAVSTGTTDVANVNFAIERLPESYSVSNNISGAPAQTNLGTQPLQGSDPEDQAAQGSWSGKSVVIDTLPTNGYILKYNGVVVTAGTPITNYNPSLLTIEPGPGSNGTQTSTFKYATIDAAGKKDPNPAGYTLTWSVPLSAQLLSFTGQASKDCNFIMNWATGKEEQLKHFAVQRSKDGIAFETIGVLSPGGSNSTYQYIDKQAKGIRQYYRLDIVDVNNKSLYSKVLSLSNHCTQSIHIYPNPAQEQLSIEGLTGNSSEIHVYSTEGKLVMTKIIAGTAAILDISALPDGIYHFKISSGTQLHTLEVIKK